MPQVGDAWIEVHADGSGLFREIQEIARAAVAGAKIKLKVDLDTKGLTGKVKAAAKAASGVGVIKFRTDLDAKGLGAKARAAARAAGGASVKIKTDLDSRGASARFLTDAEAVATGARRALLTARRALIEHPIEIPVKPELDMSSAFFTRLRAQLATRPIDLPVKPRLDRGVVRSFLSSILRDVAKATSEIGQGLAGVIQGFVIAPLKAFGGAVVTVFKFAAAQAALLTTAIAIALPFVQALGVALAGLVVDLGSAALSLAGFAAGGLVAIGTAAAATAIGLQGVAGAFKAVAKVQKLQSQGGKRTKAEQAALNKALEEQKKALSGLAVSARDFVKASVGLQGPWREFTRAIQGELFKGLGDDLTKTAHVVLPVLQKGLTGIAGTVNDLVRDFLEWARSGKGLTTISDVLKQSKGVLADLGDAAGHFGQGLLTLLTGGKKNTKGLADAFVNLSNRFMNWTKLITTPGAGGVSPLEDFFTQARSNLRKVGSLFESTGSLISSFWNNWTGAAAGARPDILADLQGQLEKWAAALRDPANQGAIKQFVTNAATDFQTLEDAVVNVSSVINNLAGVIQDLDTINAKSEKVGTGFRDKVRALLGLEPIDDKAVRRQILERQNALRQLSGLAPIPIPLDLLPEVTVEPVKVGDAQAKTRAAALKALQGQALDFEIQARGKVNVTFEPPTDEEIQTKTRQTLAARKNKFTIRGFKFEIDAKTGKPKLVFSPPTAKEVSDAANKALAKNPKARHFKVKGIDFTIDADMTVHPTVKPPKETVSLKEEAQKVLDRINRARGMFGGKPLPLVIDIDPKVHVSDTDVKNAKAAIDQAVQRAIDTGKKQPVTIGGKKFEVDVHGNLVSIDPVKPGKKPPKTPVTGVVTEVVMDVPGGMGNKVKITFDATGKIVSIEPFTGPPVDLPGRVIIDDVPPKKPRQWGHGIPVFASLTLNQASVAQVQNQARSAVGGGVTIPSQFAPLPAFPALPHPHVTVGTGYAPLPAFPRLPKKHITIGISWGRVPGLPPLPHPVIHVKVVIDDPQLAKGTAPVGNFHPDKKGATGIHVTRGPQFALIGEAGPEAVVPLRRNQPLDPAVTALLRAVATSRGLGGQPNGPLIGSLQVVAPTSDPEATAMTVVNRIAAWSGR